MRMSTPKQFLQSLCYNSCWNYAVFWKLQNQGQMLLTWEDGYCDAWRPKKSSECILHDICSKGSDLISSSLCSFCAHDDSFSEYSIELVVAEMSSVQYALGDGLVGGVAHTGNHCWMLSDNVSELAGAHKFPDEWLLQFVAGIKTIVLVPVIPHGVLQLGSLEKVSEDHLLVAYVKDQFNTHKNCMEFLLTSTSNEDFLTQSFPQMPIPLEKLEDFSAIRIGEMKSGHTQEFYSFEVENPTLSATNQLAFPCRAENSFHISETDRMGILGIKTKNDTSFQSVALTKVPEYLYQSMDCSKLRVDCTEFKLSCAEEELGSFSYLNRNMGCFVEYSNRMMNPCPEGAMMEQAFIEKHADCTVHKNISTYLSFPKDSELHKALGSALVCQDNSYMLDATVSGKDAYSSSSLIRREVCIGSTMPNALGHSGLISKEYEPVHLLEEVFTNLCDDPIDESFDKPNNEKSAARSSRKRAAPSGGQLEKSVSIEDVVQHSCVTSEFVDTNKSVATNVSPPDASFKSVISALSQEQKGDHGCPRYPRKRSRPSNISKRRDRPGDAKRPRPRDRQLIQDCVRELREFVPNGSNCSIDGLLYRTIKHVLFLKSVTDQVDKLKRCGYLEVSEPEKPKSPQKRESHRSGASWAFELGSEQNACPIIVEDLDYPGHLNIEMICNDSARFIQIADVISRLELNILKGVMERRSVHKWAQFIVEVPRGFHRLDIFWPLMQLLQQNESPIAAKI